MSPPRDPHPRPARGPRRPPPRPPVRPARARGATGRLDGPDRRIPCPGETEKNRIDTDFRRGETEKNRIDTDFRPPISADTDFRRGETEKNRIDTDFRPDFRRIDTDFRPSSSIPLHPVRSLPLKIRRKPAEPAGLVESLFLAGVGSATAGSGEFGGASDVSGDRPAPLLGFGSGARTGLGLPTSFTGLRRARHVLHQTDEDQSEYRQHGHAQQSGADSERSGSGSDLG